MLSKCCPLLLFTLLYTFSFSLSKNLAEGIKSIWPPQMKNYLDVVGWPEPEAMIQLGDTVAGFCWSAVMLSSVDQESLVEDTIVAGRPIGVLQARDVRSVAKSGGADSRS